MNEDSGQSEGKLTWVEVVLDFNGLKSSHYHFVNPSLK